MLRMLGLMWFWKRASGFSGGFVFLCCVQHMLMLCDHVRFVWAFIRRFVCYYRRTMSGVRLVGYHVNIVCTIVTWVGVSSQWCDECSVDGLI